MNFARQQNYSGCYTELKNCMICDEGIKIHTGSYSQLEIRKHIRNDVTGYIFSLPDYAGTEMGWTKCLQMCHKHQMPDFKHVMADEHFEMQ